MKLEDLQLRILIDPRQVLRGNENELAVIHLFRSGDQGLDSQFTHLRIQKDVELVHDTKRGFERLAQSKQQRNSRVTSFTTTV